MFIPYLDISKSRNVNDIAFSHALRIKQSIRHTWSGSNDPQILSPVSVAPAFYLNQIVGMKHLHYWERISRLSLMSLLRRRERFIIFFMLKILNDPRSSNDLKVSFVSRPRLGNLAVVPPKSKTSSAANQTLFDSSFAVQGHILWNAMPNHLNTIQDLEHFKSKLTQSIPDKPPIRGWNPPNKNTLLCWENERGYTIVGWSKELMAESNLSRTRHRS